MTTQEIKDLVAAKIAGQGNQVDIAGALPVILMEFCDFMDGMAPLKITDPGDFRGTLQNFAEACGVTTGEIDKILSGKIQMLEIVSSQDERLIYSRNFYYGSLENVDIFWGYSSTGDPSEDTIRITYSPDLDNLEFTHYSA